MGKSAAKTTLGLEENIESLLCYAGIWVTGLLFLLIEKDNRNVRFHALQSLIVFLGLSVLTFIIGRFSFFGYLLWLATILLWILLMVKAYQGERYKLLKIGDMVENMLGRMPSIEPSESQQPAETVAQEQPASTSDAPDTVEVPFSSKPDNKDVVLKAVEQALSVYPQLAVKRSNQTDLEIASISGAAKEQAGQKKVNYSACLLAREDDRLVLFWEMMKEGGVAQDFQPQEVSFTAEKNGLNGRKAAGESLDYEQVRVIIENTVKPNGWTFKTVLGKSKAMYPR